MPVSVALNCNIIAFAVEEISKVVCVNLCQEVVNVEVVLTNPTVLFQEPPGECIWGWGHICASKQVNRHCI